MCDGDIDSSHQKPSNEMSNSSKRWSSSGQARPRMPLLLYPRTRIPTELSKFYVISSSKTPLFDSDIDSSHQKPSNEIPNSPKRTTPTGRIRLLMTISFAIYVLTKSLHLTNYRKFTSLEAPKPQCVIVISIPLIKSRRMRCQTPQKD